MTEDGPGLIREVLKDSSLVDLVVFRRTDRISTPAFFEGVYFFKDNVGLNESRRSLPAMLFQFFRTVT